MKKLFVISLMLLIVGCTDAEVARIMANGSKADITCYSGGREIYRGISTGKVSNAGNSDGYEFKEETTGNLIRISADCIVRN